MIRKINIAMAVAFVVLLAVKGLRNLSASAAAARAAAASSAAAADDGTSLAPHVYYFNWANFSVVNTVANRNGVLLDTIRAIFPKAEFRHLRGDVPAFAKALRDDPLAVVVGYGHHRDLEGAGVVSELPLAYARLAVMTSRSNPWRYTGPKSLAGLRIVLNDDFLDFPLVKRIFKEQEAGRTEGLPKLTVVPEQRSREALAAIVEAGDADGFLVAFDRASFLPEQMSATIVQRFRRSEGIDRGDVLLHVSSKDPALRDEILKTYERGMRRIEASGERRRIFAYYGFVPEPLPADSHGPATTPPQSTAPSAE